jgi:sporulation-control protein spo0M
VIKNEGKNLNYGDGQYSMYVASVNGILIYDGIDKRDQSSIIVKPLPILQEIQENKDKKE